MARILLFQQYCCINVTIVRKSTKAITSLAYSVMLQPCKEYDTYNTQTSNDNSQAVRLNNVGGRALSTNNCNLLRITILGYGNNLILKNNDNSHL